MQEVVNQRKDRRARRGLGMSACRQREGYGGRRLTAMRIILPAQSRSHVVRRPPAHAFRLTTTNRVAAPVRSWEIEMDPRYSAAPWIGIVLVLGADPPRLLCPSWYLSSSVAYAPPSRAKLGEPYALTCSTAIPAQTSWSASPAG